MRSLAFCRLLCARTTASVATEADARAPRRRQDQRPPCRGQRVCELWGCPCRSALGVVTGQPARTAGLVAADDRCDQRLIGNIDPQATFADLDSWSRSGRSPLWPTCKNKWPEQKRRRPNCIGSDCGTVSVLFAVGRRRNQRSDVAVNRRLMLAVADRRGWSQHNGSAGERKID